jgi:hypothetical protein
MVGHGEARLRIQEEWVVVVVLEMAEGTEVVGADTEEHIMGRLAGQGGMLVLEALLL